MVNVCKILGLLTRWHSSQIKNLNRVLDGPNEALAFKDFRGFAQNVELNKQKIQTTYRAITISRKLLKNIKILKIIKVKGLFYDNKSLSEKLS